jgi:hypothetical protein
VEGEDSLRQYIVSILRYSVPVFMASKVKRKTRYVCSKLPFIYFSQTNFDRETYEEEFTAILRV